MEEDKPEYRYRLKAQIIKSGYRTLTDFSTISHIHVTRLSRICAGWEIPGPKVKKKMAESLGITIKELRELL